MGQRFILGFRNKNISTYCAIAGKHYLAENLFCFKFQEFPEGIVPSMFIVEFAIGRNERLIHVDDFLGFKTENI